MADKLYLITVEFCEAGVMGPFDSEEERDNAAREYMDDAMSDDTNVFKMYIDDERNVTTGTYLEGELDSDEEDEESENDEDEE